MLTNSFNIAPEDLRILLWDIDGTILRSTVQGGYRKYFQASMKRVFGFSGNLDAVIPSGMTDTQIISLALAENGITPDDVFAKIDELLAVFETEMKAVLAADGEPYEVLDGVPELIRLTDSDPRFVNALLTGNLSIAARLKLESVGLGHYFNDVPGAFGELSHRRTDLAHHAKQLFNAYFSYDFRPDQFIVIGDTPNDVACARAIGARAVVVLTGRGQNPQALIDAKPDAIVEDLADSLGMLALFASI